MRRLVFLGLPGAGKGTQAEIISKRHGIVHISTGDILRKAVNEGTELGKLAGGYMSRGELVPDDVIIGIIEERIDNDDVKSSGFILDGFPRTVAQAEALEKMLSKLFMPLEAAVLIDIDDRTAIERLLVRGRGDDSEDVIRNRISIYRDRTEPLVNYYMRKGLLVRVSGIGSVNEITSRIEKAVGL